MRLRDRRAALAALVLCAAYIASLLWTGLTIAEWMGLHDIQPVPDFLEQLLWFNLGLMTWRMAMRAIFVGRFYGFAQAFLSIPRTLIANYIAIFAAARAMRIYIGLLLGQPLVWDQTQHRFPTDRWEYSA